MLRIFADGRRLPALIHCAHGKDRTGVVIMLLMQLAGLTPDEVVGDYVQSETELKKYRCGPPGEVVGALCQLQQRAAQPAAGKRRPVAALLPRPVPARPASGAPTRPVLAACPAAARRSQLPVDALTRAVIPLDDVILASTEETMRRVLAWLEHKYGRVEDYLASTGGSVVAACWAGAVAWRWGCSARVPRRCLI